MQNQYLCTIILGLQEKQRKTIIHKIKSERNQEMSIVTFANLSQYETGQTLMAAAVACCLGIEHNYKILLLTTDFNDKTLENSFWNGYQKERFSNILSSRFLSKSFTPSFSESCLPISCPPLPYSRPIATINCLLITYLLIRYATVFRKEFVRSPERISL